MSSQSKAVKNQMPKTAEREETKASVEISEAEYNSLKAAAELLRHPDVLIRTLEAAGRDRGQSLEDAFDGLETHRNQKRRVGKSA